jgi:hypothetical protein
MLITDIRSGERAVSRLMAVSLDDLDEAREIMAAAPQEAVDNGVGATA